MAKKQSKKEMTPEELRAQQIKLDSMTLENAVFQNLMGSTDILENQSLYGSLAVESAKSNYDGAMTSDEAGKARNKSYRGKKEEAKRLGIHATPSISDYDVEKEMRQQFTESRLRLPLGNLEAIVKKVAPNFKAGLPEELKSYVPGELHTKIAITQARNPQASEEEILQSALNPVEKDALAYSEILNRAYTRGAASRIVTSGYFTELNEAAKQISEKYKKPEKN